MSRGPDIDYVEKSFNYPQVMRLVNPGARDRVMSEIPARSRAYLAAGDTTHGHFELRDASAARWRGVMDFGSIPSWPLPWRGNSWPMAKAAIWRVPGQGSAGFSELFEAYRMSVVDLQSGKWYVKEISAATEAVGAK